MPLEPDVVRRVPRRGPVTRDRSIGPNHFGLFVGIAFSTFSTNGQLGFLITTPLLGAVFGLVWSQLGFTTMTRGGERDFA